MEKSASKTSAKVNLFIILLQKDELYDESVIYFCGRTQGFLGKYSGFVKKNGRTHRE
jgi:hypothetical protein